MINEVRLMGRLARDPKLSEFTNGGAVCNLRVITSRTWNDRASGAMREKIEGHTVVIHVAPIARRAAETLKKGSLVYVAGALETRKWDGSDGVARYSTEVVIRPYQGTLRRMPSHYSAQSAPMEASQNEAPKDDEMEIDYMSEMGGINTITLGDDGSDPFS